MFRWTLLFTFSVMAAAGPVSSVLKLDISPEEAAQYLASPPFTQPELATRTELRPLVRWDSPQFREADAGPTRGHYWRDGHEIENTGDYVEEVYNAAQFHGQDGLGAYTYGYKAPESAKLENRQRTGRVEGAYTYINRYGGQPVQVRYWADHDGFHQEDNLPKVELKPAQETEEVHQARLAHERAYAEIANAHRQAGQQQSFQQNDYYTAAASERHAAPTYRNTIAPAYENTIAPTYGNAAAPAFGNAAAPAFGNAAAPTFGNAAAPAFGNAAPTAYGNAAVPAYNAASAYGNAASSTYNNVATSAYSSSDTARDGKAIYSQQPQQQYSTPPAEPEPTGPPRGFFYSFEYPVSIIKHKSEAEAEAAQAHA